MLRSARSGYTLAELLVAMAIGLIVLVVVGAFFSTSLSAYQRVASRRDLQASITTTLARMAAELRASSLQTLTLASADATYPTMMAFRTQRSEGTASTSFVPATEFIVYFLDSEGQWVRKTWSNGAGGLLFAPDPVVTGQRLTLDQALRITQVPNGSERTLVRGVTALVLTPASFPTTEMVDTLGIRMTARHALDSSAIGDTFSTSVAMRNL